MVHFMYAKVALKKGRFFYMSKTFDKILIKYDSIVKNLSDLKMFHSKSKINLIIFRSK